MDSELNILMISLTINLQDTKNLKVQNGWLHFNVQLWFLWSKFMRHWMDFYTSSWPYPETMINSWPNTLADVVPTFCFIRLTKFVSKYIIHVILFDLSDFRSKLTTEFYQNADRIGGIGTDGTYDRTYLSVYDLMTHSEDIETEDSFQYTLVNIFW